MDELHKSGNVLLLMVYILQGIIISANQCNKTYLSELHDQIFISSSLLTFCLTFNFLLKLFNKDIKYRQFKEYFYRFFIVLSVFIANKLSFLETCTKEENPVIKRKTFVMLRLNYHCI